MPAQTPAHIESLSAYLAQVYTDITLSDDEVMARKAAVDNLEKELHEHCPSLKC